MKGLAKLISPYNIEEFLTENWTKKAVVISSENSQRFKHLFSWEKLTYLLNFYPLSYPTLELVLNGKHLDREDPKANLIQRCQEGATLIVNALHQIIPEIAELSSEISYELGHPINNCTAFCSWPKKGGFTSHFDILEGFILQIDGRKEWHIFEDTFKYPLPGERSNVFSPPEGKPYLTCVLNPGDVLYVPRGHWHYALALDEPSLHLSVGVICRTGVDFLDWLVRELRQREAWRKSMPLMTGEDDYGVGANYIDGLFQDLVEFFVSSDRDIASEYIDYLARLSMPFERYSLPAQAGFNVFPSGMKTRFRILNFQRFRMSELNDGSGCRITVGHKQIDLNGVTPSLVEDLFSRDSFTASEFSSMLPNCDWETDISPLLSTLVNAGIIWVDTSLSG